METPHDTAVSATKHTETNKKPHSSVSPHQGRHNHSSKGPGKEKCTKTPPKAKLRHDDSQIQFAAIESSPIEMYDLDLQRLTERQKEVKERQSRNVAVLFPQMNSSPIRKTDRMAVTLPRLSLSQVKPSAVNHDYEDESSPVFPSAEMLSKENLGSSPTPSAGRTPSDQTGIDIPLSPSGTPSIFNTPSFLKDSSQQDEIMGSPILPKARQESETYANELQTPQGPTLEVSKDVQSNIHSEGIIMQGLCPSDQAVANGFLKDLEPLVSNANPDKPNNAILSNTGVFVDAPSEVNTDIISSNQTAASVEIGDDSMNEQRRTTRTQASNTQPSSSIDNMGKSVATEEIFMSTEDNDASQVTDSMIQFLDNPSDDDDRKIQEQLALELEHASSQTNSFATEAPPPTASARKRKAGSSKEPSPQKKSRRRRSSSNVQVLIDASQPSSVEDDAVVVDVRPATGVIGTRSATVMEENETSSSPKLSKVDVPRTLRSTKATRVEANRISAGAAGSSRRRSTRLAQSSSFDRANEVSGNAAPRRGGKAPLGDQASVTEPTTDAIKQELIQDDDNGSSSLPTDISSAAFEADDLSLPAETGTETVATAGEILAGFHAQLERLKRAELRPEEERAIVGAAFEIVREAHEAGRRSHRRSVS